MFKENSNLLLKLESNHPPGLISAPAREGTETHKTISASTTNTIKNLAVLRARLHLLSHKECLVLSGKQREINFLIFIGSCGHGSKPALGACGEPLGARLPWAPAHPLPSCNGNQPLLLIPRVSNPNHRMVHHIVPQKIPQLVQNTEVQPEIQRNLLQILSSQALWQQRQEKIAKQQFVFPSPEQDYGFGALTISRS